jgi:hypothetical protein
MNYFIISSVPNTRTMPNVHKGADNIAAAFERIEAMTEQWFEANPNEELCYATKDDKDREVTIWQVQGSHNEAKVRFTIARNMTPSRTTKKKAS